MAPISPKTLGSNLSEWFLLRLLSLRQSVQIQLLGGLQSLRVLRLLKWPVFTFKCQNFEKSYEINFKDDIFLDHISEVYTFK